MSAPKTTAYAVTAWPVNRDARLALEDYIDVRSAGQYSVLGGAGLDFSGADLHDVNLSEAYLAMARLDGVNLGGVDLNRGTLTGASMHRTNLAGAYLHKAEADGCDAFSVNLSDVNLFRASFINSDLRYANLQRCQLSSTNFRGADLRNADLRGCQFGPSPARLSEAQLSGSKILGATGEIWGPIRISDEVVLNGGDLQKWFALNGAPDVHILT